MANNLHSPVLNTETTTLALFRLWHVLGGIYFWELFTTLDYEWGVIRGRLPRRYTIWIYSLTRLTSALGLVVFLVGLDPSTSINCQLWISFSGTFFLVSSIAASLLLVLRIIAIWGKHKAVTAISIIIWGTGCAFHINAVVRLRSTSNPQVKGCSAVTTEKTVLGLIPMILSDLVLILIMLVGLLLLRHRGGGMFGLTPILWRQAVIWLSLSIVTVVPPAVMAILSTNEPLSNLLLTPYLITMTTTATRTYRSLVDYASEFSDGVSAAQENDSQPGVFSTFNGQIHMVGSRLTVHTASKQHTTIQVNDPT